MANAGTSGNDFATLTPPGQLPKIDSIFDVSANFLAQLRLWLEQNPPAIGIKNIIGFSQYAAAMNVTANNEARTSSTYGDLTHTGPTLSNLADGQYIVLWGAIAAGVAGVSNANMAVSVNGAAAPGGTNGLTALTNVSSFASIVAADTFILKTGSGNSLQAKYNSSDNASSCQWLNRWLLAFKYANA